MFCKWCGKKIANVGNPCPSCGKEQGPLVNGNGFWDLCSKLPNNNPIDSGTVAPVRIDDPAKTDSPKKSAAQKGKTPKGFWICAWVATCFLLVIACFLVGECMGKIEQCLSEISALRSSVFSVKTLVENGFNKSEEYHQDEPDALEPTEPQEDTEESTNIDIEALLADDNNILFEATKLDVAIYEIETTPAMCVYLAVGELLEGKDIRLFWQKSADQGETWETILENASYVVAEANETDAYRVICIVPNDSEEGNLYYMAAIGLGENSESQIDAAETSPENESAG